MLSKEQLEAMNARMSANVDTLIANGKAAWMLSRRVAKPVVMTERQQELALIRIEKKKQWEDQTWKKA